MKMLYSGGNLGQIVLGPFAVQAVRLDGMMLIDPRWSRGWARRNGSAGCVGLWGRGVLTTARISLIQTTLQEGSPTR
ncbi:unnamed protein product [Periconia digitata]|uniref:Uncharacterized protein n=1 Tax=Periconia digitata TaxID=1303443 RepID=A0A9W4UAT2_9PLEO|nr:unnamed protein product [Periconia digitata]